MIFLSQGLSIWQKDSCVPGVPWTIARSSRASPASRLFKMLFTLFTNLRWASGEISYIIIEETGLNLLDETIAAIQPESRLKWKVWNLDHQAQKQTRSPPIVPPTANPTGPRMRPPRAQTPPAIRPPLVHSLTATCFQKIHFWWARLEI